MQEGYRRCACRLRGAGGGAGSPAVGAALEHRAPGRWWPFLGRSGLTELRAGHGCSGLLKAPNGGQGCFTAHHGSSRLIASSSRAHRELIASSSRAHRGSSRLIAAHRGSSRLITARPSVRTGPLPSRACGESAPAACGHRGRRTPLRAPPPRRRAAGAPCHIWEWTAHRRKWAARRGCGQHAMQPSCRRHAAVRPSEGSDRMRCVHVHAGTGVGILEGGEACAYACACGHGRGRT